MRSYTGNSTTSSSGVYSDKAYYGYSPINFGSLPSPKRKKETVTDDEIYYVLI